MKDRKLNIYLGEGRKAARWEPDPRRWVDLLFTTLSPVALPVTAEAYRELPDLDRLKMKDCAAYVAGELEGGVRKAGTVVSRSMFTLDADEPCPDFLRRVAVALHGSAYLIHETISSTDDSPRYRLVVPLARDLSPAEYDRTARALATAIDAGSFDKTTFSPSRLMYRPTAFEGSAFSPVHGLGDLYDPPAKDSPSHDELREKSRVADPRNKKGVVGAFCRAYPVSAAIAAFLPETFLKEGAPDRYRYRAARSAGGVVTFDDTHLYSFHETDPHADQLLNAYDLVRLHLHGKTKKAEAEFRDVLRRDKIVVAEMTEETKERALEAFGGIGSNEATPDWEERLQRDRAGVCVSNGHNVGLVLGNDKNLVGRFRRDTFKDRYYTKPLIGETEGEWVTARDVDYGNLRVYFDKAYGIRGAQAIEDGVRVRFELNSSHPVREYLKGLEWDGVERIGGFFHKYLGAEEGGYVAEVSKTVLAAAVARVFRPGIKYDLVVVFVGEEGIGKSWLLELLGGDWHSDTFTTMQGKEAFEQLRGKWIIEMGELSAMRKAELVEIKHFITKTEDSYRPAFGRHVEDYPRQCVLFGTTNAKQFLSDMSGNRRFIPIDVDISRARVPVTDEGFEASVLAGRDQIWAEAVRLYGDGQPLHLKGETLERAKFEQGSHMQDDPRLGRIEDFLETAIPEGWDKIGLMDRLAAIENGSTGTIRRRHVCTYELWCEALGIPRSQMNAREARQLNELMRSVSGWVYEGRSRTFPIYGKQKSYARK